MKEITTVKMDNDTAINWDILIDFTMATWRKLETTAHDKHIFEIDLWQGLGIYVFPWVVKYVTWSQELVNPGKGFDVLLKENRDFFCTLFSYDLGERMVNAIQNQDDLTWDLIQEVYLVLYGADAEYDNYMTRTVMYNMLYSEKYLLYREYANSNNTETARKLLYNKYLMTKDSYPVISQNLSVMWMDLDD